jgi:TetR/AcrR family transcriptional regulator, lmrAB and yxaGH operons repressor
MIETMHHQLQTRGYAASGLNELVANSGAPKGSIYHYFPGGKEEIAAAALREAGVAAGAATLEAFRRHRSATAAIKAIINWLSTQLVESDFRYGCPIATTTLEMASESDTIQHACRDAYNTWLDAFHDGLASHGINHRTAKRLGIVTLSAIEGALILSRAQRDVTPLRHAAAAVADLLD